MGQLVVLCRLVFMTGALLGLLALHDRLLGPPRSDAEFYSAHVGSLVLLSTLGFYALCKLGQLAFVRPRHILDSRGSQYLHMEGGRTEIVMGLPKLTIENIWILVYGLGATFFVVAYCFLGIEPVCMNCMGIGLAGLCLDELISPRHEMNRVYKVVRMAALLAGITSLILTFAEHFPYLMQHYIGSSNWPAAIAGVGMPFLSQFLMLCVRDYRKYTVGGVLEMCEFGFPFAVIISVCMLSTAEGERRQTSAEISYNALVNETMEWYLNLTVPEADHSVTRWGIFLGLAPLLLAPNVILYVACVLDGTAIDSLLCIGMAVSIEYCTRAEPTVIHIYASLCSLAGMILRVCSEYTPHQLPPFTQQDKTHLTERVIRKGHGPSCNDSETESLAAETGQV